ncbi:putative cyclin-D6-1 [Prunus yedoensis var. nudiflora]|uniref:B-like cyclin n=1 Tax=Prunus yedoensis var. nudiflora TaxID=2094558 RepID=A0A314UXX5_PRUYE|nr:putative cyclin-D6-1 [Prunus yedoensis var. nudiflora]
MELDLENPLTISHDIHSDTLTSLFSLESDHMPSETYFQTLQARDFGISIRREAIASISQLCCNYDNLLQYLAVNYLDRFLSCQGMLQPKPWLIKLLAISCVSLAAKMKKADFSLADVQALKARAAQIIFKSQKDVELLGFKPSIIAASALLFASHELFPMQYPCFKKALSNCSYVNTENMLQCYSAMQDIVADGFDSVLEMVSSSVTAANVLDHNFSSSAESGKTTVTGMTTLRLERDMKRRKISEYCKDHRVQISQIQNC